MRYSAQAKTRIVKTEQKSTLQNVGRTGIAEKKRQMMWKQSGGHKIAEKKAAINAEKKRQLKWKKSGQMSTSTKKSGSVTFVRLRTLDNGLRCASLTKQDAKDSIDN